MIVAENESAPLQFIPIAHRQAVELAPFVVVSRTVDVTDDRKNDLKRLLSRNTDGVQRISVDRSDLLIGVSKEEDNEDELGLLSLERKSNETESKESSLVEGSGEESDEEGSGEVEETIDVSTTATTTSTTTTTTPSVSEGSGCALDTGRVPLAAFDPFTMPPQYMKDRLENGYRPNDTIGIRVQFCRPLSVVLSDGHCYTYYIQQGVFPLTCTPNGFRHGLSLEFSVNSIFCYECDY